jgi:hypothetical protein
MPGPLQGKGLIQGRTPSRAVDPEFLPYPPSQRLLPDMTATLVVYHRRQLQRGGGIARSLQEPQAPL